MNRPQPSVKIVSGISDLEALAAGDVVKVMLETEPRWMVYEGVINRQHSFMSWPFSVGIGFIMCWRSEPQHLLMGGGAIIFDKEHFSSDAYYSRRSPEYREKEAMLQAAREYVGV